MKKVNRPTKRSLKKVSSISIVNPNAAGIDIGDTMHVVAVPEGRSEQSVREFGTMTCDLNLIVEWLVCTGNPYSVCCYSIISKYLW